MLPEVDCVASEDSSSSVSQGNGCSSFSQRPKSMSRQRSQQNGKNLLLICGSASISQVGQRGRNSIEMAMLVVIDLKDRLIYIEFNTSVYSSLARQIVSIPHSLPLRQTPNLIVARLSES